MKNSKGIVALQGYHPTSFRILYSSLLSLLCCLTCLASPYDSSKSGYQCLQKAKDLEVLWQADWLPHSPTSLEDHGLLYKITKVAEKKNLIGVATRVTTLTMEAISKGAKEKNRKLKITREEKARSVCLKIQTNRPRRQNLFDTAIPDINKDAGAPRKGEEFSALPYITFERQNGWVRADVPKDGELTRCDVDTKQFSCLVRLKKRFSAELSELEQVLRLYKE